MQAAVKYSILAALVVFTSVCLAGEDRYLRHARSQYERKNYLTAADSYLKALQYAKGEFTAADFYQLALSLKEAKKFSDAVPHYETAIMKNHEQSPAILLELARMYSMLKNEKTSQRYLRLAVIAGKNPRLPFLTRNSVSNPSRWQGIPGSATRISSPPA